MSLSARSTGADSGSKRCRHPGIAAVGGIEELHQVVGADREEIDPLQQFVELEQQRRHFQHGADLHPLRQRVAVPAQMRQLASRPAPWPCRIPRPSRSSGTSRATRARRRRAAARASGCAAGRAGRGRAGSRASRAPDSPPRSCACRAAPCRRRYRGCGRSPAACRRRRARRGRARAARRCAAKYRATMNCNSVRNRPMPAAPVSSICGRSIGRPALIISDDLAGRPW